MPNWGRQLLAAAGGLVAAALLVATAEYALHRLLAGDSLFAAVALTLGLAALAGGWIAGRLTGGSRTAIWIVTVALALLSLVNILSFPHPMWFAPLAAAALLAGTWLALRASRRGEVAA